MEDRKIGKTLHILGVLRHGDKMGRMEGWKIGQTLHILGVLRHGDKIERLEGWKMGRLEDGKDEEKGTPVLRELKLRRSKTWITLNSVPRT